MTLKALCEQICSLAKADSLVASARYGGSVYEINGDDRTPVRYALLYVQPSSPHTVTDNTVTYGLNIYYLDRLTDDLANVMDVQSDAVIIIDNLVRAVASLDDVVEVTSPYQIINYVATEAFNDRLAGAYASNLQVTVLKGTKCYE